MLTVSARRNGDMFTHQSDDAEVVLMDGRVRVNITNDEIKLTLGSHISYALSSGAMDAYGSSYLRPTLSFIDTNPNQQTPEKKGR